jgi:hypothetical protein
MRKAKLLLTFLSFRSSVDADAFEVLGKEFEELLRSPKSFVALLCPSVRGVRGEVPADNEADETDRGEYLGGLDRDQNLR